MNASLIAVYMKPDAGMDLGFLEELVRGGGFRLHNPQTGHITLIDDEGDFYVVARDALSARLIQCEDTRLQFWESNCEGKYVGDLYCRVRFRSEAIVVEIGELPRDSECLLRGIWVSCRERLDDGSIIGLIVDREGVTEEYADWDAFFIGRTPYEGPCPDVLCVENGQERLLPASCLTHRREARSRHIIAFEEQMAGVLAGHP
jgi:hypothetical protein